jgi:hypothetical protein
VGRLGRVLLAVHDEEDEKRNNGDDAQDLNHDDSPSAAMASTLLTNTQIGIVGAFLSRHDPTGGEEGSVVHLTRTLTRPAAAVEVGGTRAASSDERRE